MKVWVTIALLSLFALETFGHWNYGTMSKRNKQYLIHRLDSLQLSNCYFKRVYATLDSSKYVFKLSFQSSKNLASFTPTNDGGIINFSNLSVLYDDEAIFEEFFHAFQYLFYCLPTHLKKGGSNVEYEAKLFRAIQAIEQGKPMTETPSQKGLLAFVLSLLNEQGKFCVEKFRLEEQKRYIACVRHFQQHWLVRNQMEKEENIYEQKVIEDWQPLALFYLIARCKQ